MQPHPNVAKYLAEFTRCIHERKQIEVRFYSKKDDDNVTRRCAPVDFAVNTRYKDDLKRFFVWNYRGPSDAHLMGIDPAVIVSMTFLEESFDPSEIPQVPTYEIARDWS